MSKSLLSPNDKKVLHEVFGNGTRIPLVKMKWFHTQEREHAGRLFYWHTPTKVVEILRRGREAYNEQWFLECRRAMGEIKSAKITQN